MRPERLGLGGVSLLLVGSLGLRAAGFGGGRPGRLMVGAAMALACLPLVALEIAEVAERLCGPLGRRGAGA